MERILLCIMLGHYSSGWQIPARESGDEANDLALPMTVRLNALARNFLGGHFR